MTELNVNQFFELNELYLYWCQKVYIWIWGTLDYFLNKSQALRV